ncbi:MAG: MBL fold metallo-hydrolase [Acidobacteriaceae bacterium]
MTRSKQPFLSETLDRWRQSAIKMASLAVLAALILGLTAMHAQTASSHFRRHKVSFAKPLTVYFVDVEGGHAALYVTPSHQSLLVDTGWPDHNGRDADRIMAVAKQAGLDHIDYLMITHYHEDHVGGVPNLVQRIHINAFIDHGPNRETSNAPTQEGYGKYQAVLAQQIHAKHILARPGETIPLAGLTTTIVSADGKVLATPLPGAGQPNPYCKTTPTRPQDQTENGRSDGIVMQYGKTHLVDLGDLTWDREMQLMCPINKLGKMDVYVVSHHGWYPSSSPAFVDGIAPRIAIMGNGENKGGTPSVWDIIEKSPRLNDLWQLHYSAEGGSQHNVAPANIANLKGASIHNGTDGNYIRLLAYPDGKLVVYNSRTNQSKTYPPVQ